MFSVTSSTAPSTAMNPAVQGMACPAGSPVVSRVGNVHASVGASLEVLNEPLIDIGPPEEAGASADAQQVFANRRLRAAVAYGEVMGLLRNYPTASSYHALEEVACSLMEAIRTGWIPLNGTYETLYKAFASCDPAGPLNEPLKLAALIISDNENPSLDKLSDERVHLAHVVISALLAADASSDSQDSSPGSAEVISGLAKCVTLYDAMRALDHSMESMSPAREFRQQLEVVRAYLQECFAPAFKPNRFPVEPQWKAAMDSFPLPADGFPLRQTHALDAKKGSP